MTYRYIGFTGIFETGHLHAFLFTVKISNDSQFQIIKAYGVTYSLTQVNKQDCACGFFLYRVWLSSKAQQSALCWLKMASAFLTEHSFGTVLVARMQVCRISLIDVHLNLWVSYNIHIWPASLAASLVLSTELYTTNLFYLCTQAGANEAVMP